MSNRWALLALLCFTRATMGIQSSSIPPVVPHLVAELGLSYAQVGWLIGLFSGPGLALAFLGGLLAAWLGDKRVIVFGLALLVLGAEILATAPGFGQAVSGRVLSGIGFVLVNMLMMKVVTDRFAGSSLSTAMGILMMSWPLGISLALVVLGGLAESAGWRTAMHATGMLSLVPFLLVWFLAPGNPDQAEEQAASTGKKVPESVWPTPWEVLLIVMVSVLWGLYNAGFTVFVGFAPSLLVTRGMNEATASATVSAATWVWVVSLPLGGWLVDRLGKIHLFIILGALGSALLLGVLPYTISTEAPALALALILSIGLVFGLCPGAVMALPAQVMRPPVRSIGFGVFYTGNYLLMGALPPTAGWLLDLSGVDAVPVWFSGSLFLAMPLMLGIFLSLQRRGS